MKRWIPVLPLIVAASLSGTAPAGSDEPASIFVTGVLDPIPTGARLLYRHERRVEPASEQVPELAAATAEIALAPGEGGGRIALVQLMVNGREQLLPPLPAGAGHPLLLVFLEATVRNMAALTGGSPFYIRNRIREALARGGTGADHVFRPFANDPNRARMGAFADLEIRFALRDDIPGRFARFEAVSGAGGDGTPTYRDTMAFESIEKE